MSKSKIAALVALAVALAAAGAGWKWVAPVAGPKGAGGHEKIAGWTCDRPVRGSF